MGTKYCAPTNMNKVAIGLDVGGTNIRAGAVNENAELIGEIVSDISPSDKSKDDIISAILSLINKIQISAVNDGFKVNACCMGIPDPFDYEKGISWMKHKFPSLYGVNLKQIFEEKLGIPVYFVGDAQAFGLGVSWLEHRDIKRLLVITLGTGLGAGFVVDGRLGKAEDSIPPNGQIWNLKYKEGILEDYISKTAIMKSYTERSGKSEEVKNIAELARKGDAQAIETFADLAKNVGEGLSETIKDFKPEMIVFGGKIGANAFDLFGKRAEEVFKEKSGMSVPFVPTKNEFLAIYGAAYYAMKTS